MKIQLDFCANKDCSDVKLDIYCDDHQIFGAIAQETSQTVIHDVPENPGDHVLKLIMTGKNRTHTRVDAQGNIVDDVFFTIQRLEFEDLDVREIFCQGRECYTHSFNSDRPGILDEFYGSLGCNGVVEMRFSLPIFLWLNDYLD
jgi:hypothetical protein